MAKMNVDTDLIRALAALLDETNLTEIEVSEEGRTIRIARQGGPVIHAAPVVASAPLAAPAVAAAAPTGGVEAGTVTSPMVGTVYLAPEPGAPPFVSVGDMVVKGQTLLIVEAMKTMNPIPAPQDGRVERILVANAQPVEYGEALLIVR